MSEKDLDKFQKDIDKQIGNESLRESLKDKAEKLDRNITKVQRPEQWPEPPEKESGDK